MKRSVVVIFASVLCSVGCSTRQVDLFPDRPPVDSGEEVVDAGFPDAEPIDVGFADSGVGIDTGRARVLRCPKTITTDVGRFESVRTELGIEVAASPDWNSYLFAHDLSEDGVTHGTIFRAGGLANEQFGGGGLRGGALNDPPQLVAFGDDRFAWLGHADPTKQAMVVGTVQTDDSFYRYGPANYEAGLHLVDAVATSRDFVLALTSTSGDAWLARTSFTGVPRGCMQDKLAVTDDLTYQQIKLSEHEDTVWMASTSSIRVGDQVGMTFDLSPISGCRPGASRSVFDCATPSSFDIAAVDEGAVFVTRQCQGYTETMLHAPATSRTGFLLRDVDLMASATQVAYDGRVLGITRWLRGAPSPTVQFYSVEGTQLTDPLPIEIERGVTPISMDVAGAVATDDGKSYWILGVIGRSQGGNTNVYTVQFEGCALE